MLFSPQIPLPLEPRGVERLDDFVAGPNAPAVEAVNTVVAEPGSSLFLHGPASSGKTHLLNGACVAARDGGLTAFYLGLRNLPEGGDAALRGLEGVDLVCVDDLHAVAGDRDWEEALFHFINRHREAHGRLIVSSRERLRRLPLGLPDLASRLAWGVRAALQGLEDDDKVRVMVRHARALGAELPEDVAAYLLRHGQRDLASLIAAVGRLQHAAFTEKRRITVPLARQVLNSRA